MAGDAEVAALQTTVLEHRRTRFPRDRRGNHDRRPADAGGCDDAQQRSGRIDERTAGESIVHRRGSPKHLINRPPAAGAQRTADDGNDPSAGAQRVAPRSSDGEREMADARRFICGGNRRAGKSGHTQQRKARRRIPAGQLSFERRTIVTTHLQSVLTAKCAHGCDDDVRCEDEAARRAAGAVDLDADGAADATESANASESSVSWVVMLRACQSESS